MFTACSPLFTQVFTGFVHPVNMFTTCSPGEHGHSGEHVHRVNKSGEHMGEQR